MVSAAGVRRQLCTQRPSATSAKKPISPPSTPNTMPTIVPPLVPRCGRRGGGRGRGGGAACGACSGDGGCGVGRGGRRVNVVELRVTRCGCGVDCVRPAPCVERWEEVLFASWELVKGVAAASGVAAPMALPVLTSGCRSDVDADELVRLTSAQTHLLDNPGVRQSSL